MLLEAEVAGKVHDALLVLGYQCLYRSGDAANYLRGREGLDLLYAHRPLARRLLAQASERETPMGRLRDISVEGLIGFKLQGFVIGTEYCMSSQKGPDCKRPGLLLDPRLY